MVTVTSATTTVVLGRATSGGAVDIGVFGSKAGLVFSVLLQADKITHAANAIHTERFVVEVNFFI